MMKPMVLHSNRHLHAVTPAKEEQWRAWNNVNSTSCMHPQNASARRLFMKLMKRFTMVMTSTDVRALLSPVNSYWRDMGKYKFRLRVNHTGHCILLSLRHIYHSKQKSEDMHVLGANYLPKAIGHQSRLSSVEEPPSYPPCSFQSWHIITSGISACRVNTG